MTSIKVDRPYTNPWLKNPTYPTVLEHSRGIVEMTWEQRIGRSTMDSRPDLSSQERKALEAILDAWCRSDFPLPGDVSYQDVFDLCNTLGIAVPTELVDMLRSYGSS